MKKPFKLYRSTDKKFYFVFMAQNGRVVSTSETYTRKRNAIKGVVSMVNTLTAALDVSDYTVNIENLIEDLTND